nr:hypothetical protein BaRGS_022925 [Batillaria attramentaria]
MVIACKMLKQEAALVVVGALVVLQLQSVAGHGYVLDPPQRSTMWRVGYDTPANYDDNQLFCGGFSRQWGANGGKCGICGDPYDAQEKPNEAGGKYATGIIVKTYDQSQIIDVAVKITANHMGYFLFKLCPNNDVTKEATQECLDQHVLQSGRRQQLRGPDHQGTNSHRHHHHDQEASRDNYNQKASCDDDHHHRHHHHHDQETSRGNYNQKASDDDDHHHRHHHRDETDHSHHEASDDNDQQTRHNDQEAHNHHDQEPRS